MTMVVIVTTYKSPRAPVIWTARYPVLQVPALSDYSYWQALHLLWEQDVIIVNIEHDIFPTKGQVDELLQCPRDFCAKAYKSPDDKLVRDGKLDYIQPTGWDIQGWNDGRPIEVGDTEADVAGIGFCKIGTARRRILEPVPWYLVDTQINMAVKAEGKWHMHWPLIHHQHNPDYGKEKEGANGDKKGKG